MKIMLGLGALILLSLFLIQYLNDRGESRFHKKLVAYCQFTEIAKELNSFYQANGYYLSESDWQLSIDLSLLNERCYEDYSEYDNTFYDIFGASYKYEKLNGTGMRLTRVRGREEPQNLDFEQIMVFKLGKRVE